LAEKRGCGAFMTHKDLETYIYSLPNVKLDYPFGKEVAVYKVTVGTEEKMFALIPEGKTPLQISLKCDPQLAILLREKYESVMQGYHLNKKHWNTMLLTGQLTEEEVTGLILHSYNLVTSAGAETPDFS
jgi:predicted DNA-binding protein (MmcQ/YjbR family)